MKAITVRQPFAEAIARGLKRDELRSKSTQYRGELAIHAALKSAKPEMFKIYPLPQELINKTDELPRGAVVAIAELYDDVLGDDGYHHWKLRNARRLPKPIPAKGQLGIWNWKPRKTLKAAA